ncbi:MAG: hypothetical protein KA309_10585 [Giesbergeria sp.]|nr:hypothetical protein [Giesbergeria sp.]
MGGILGQKVSANSKNTDLLLPLYFVAKSFAAVARSACQAKTRKSSVPHGIAAALRNLTKLASSPIDTGASSY